MPMTQQEAGRLLSASTNQAAYNAATTSRLHLCTNATAPTNTTAGTGVSGGSYAPQNVTWYAPVQGTPTTTIANNGAITFAGMPAVTVQYVEVYDSSNASVSASNRKWFGQLTNTRTTAAGDTLTFADSNLVLGVGVT